MPHYAVYRPSTGQILFTADGPADSVLETYEPQGFGVLEAPMRGSDATHRVEGGELVALPPRPSLHHEFDHAAKAWIDQRRLPDSIRQQLALVRQERDRRLQACDWTELPSALARLSSSRLTDWAAYRQALRDAPAQPDPFAVKWPTAPLA